MVIPDDHFRKREETRVDSADTKSIQPTEYVMGAITKPARRRAILLVFGIAVAWVATSELAKASQDAAPNSPFFTLYFSTSLLSVFLLHPAVRRLPPRSETNAKLGPTRAVAVFLTTWTLCNYLYIRALVLIPAATVTAVFRCVHQSLPQNSRW